MHEIMVREDNFLTIDHNPLKQYGHAYRIRAAIGKSYHCQSYHSLKLEWKTKKGQTKTQLEELNQRDPQKLQRYCPEHKEIKKKNPLKTIFSGQGNPYLSS